MHIAIHKGGDFGAWGMVMSFPYQQRMKLNKWKWAATTIYLILSL
jgi:hypothetical protein